MLGWVEVESFCLLPLPLSVQAGVGGLGFSCFRKHNQQQAQAKQSERNKKAAPTLSVDRYIPYCDRNTLYKIRDNSRRFKG